jgi:hypothetical protein
MSLEYLEPGNYRNSQGIVIEVEDLADDYHTLGGIWHAVSYDERQPDFTRQRMLVTAESMGQFGYERVETA